MTVSESYFILLVGCNVEIRDGKVTKDHHYVRESDWNGFGAGFVVNLSIYGAESVNPGVGKYPRAFYFRDETTPLDEPPLPKDAFQFMPLATQHDVELDREQERRNNVMRDALANLG